MKEMGFIKDEVITPSNEEDMQYACTEKYWNSR